MPLSFFTCAFNSSIVRRLRASSVISQVWRADTRSSRGAGGGPFRRRLSERDGLLLPCESREVEEEDLVRSMGLSREPEYEGCKEGEGRMSFFCVEAGRISSRETGIPRLTRKSRRMRDRIQSGGWRGGGATNCDQSDADRGVRNMGLGFSRGGRIEVSIVSEGNI